MSCYGCAHCGCDPDDPDDSCWTCEECDYEADDGDEPYDIQTAVMDALPHATHPMFAKADELIKGLDQRGFKIVPKSEEVGRG